ncbi:MAG: gliding motility-associated C-terminal domain-containing protein [Chitinophagia bacterium]|nr:gliding motility-associated C-terminal domain-containing protein [Chitinophagia bacterium]
MIFSNFFCIWKCFHNKCFSRKNNTNVSKQKPVVSGIVPIDTTTPAPGVPIPNWDEDPPYSLFPNAFSPNGNNKNDVFRLVYNPNTLIEDYSLRIFDRWGELVFLTNDVAKGWDGTYKGQPCEIGAYFYLATFKANYMQQMLKGDVTLIR